MNIRIWFLVLVCSTIAAAKWTPEAMMGVKTLSSPQFSPDNQSLVFVVQEPQGDHYNTTIYQVDSDGKGKPRPIKSAAFFPRWSPDGKSIAFISNRSGVNQLFLMPAEGGKETQLTQGTENVQNFRFSPDGKSIAYVMGEKVDGAPENEPCLYGEETKVNRLWLISLGEEPKPLTPLKYYVRGEGDLGTRNEEFDFSPDGKKIVFAYTTGLGFEAYYTHSELATVELATGKIQEWEEKASYNALPHYSPDGKWVAYLILTPERSLRVSVCNAEGERVKQLDFTSSDSIYFVGPNLLGWTNDSQNVLIFESTQTSYHIAKLPIDGGESSDIDTKGLFFLEPVLSHDDATVAYIGESSTEPQELYVSKIDGFQPVQLSKLNATYLTYPKFKTEEITWKAEDGMTISGLLTYPAGYKPGKPVPLLVTIHGGPAYFFDNGFIGKIRLGSPYPYPVFAEKGYAILRPNPRGSIGRGETFRLANMGDWAGKDYGDIIAGVDHLISQKIADPKKMGIMGWSYGGYLSAWAVTQTNRFKAASIGAAVVDLISMAGTTDIHFFTPFYLKTLWENPQIYIERSPIFHAHKVQTPCLMQHGTADQRVPVAQSYEFYNALKSLNKTVNLILYPGMPHGISNPEMYQEALESNLSWFEKHIPVK